MLETSVQKLVTTIVYICFSRWLTLAGVITMPVWIFYCFHGSHVSLLSLWCSLRLSYLWDTCLETKLHYVTKFSRFTTKLLGKIGVSFVWCPLHSWGQTFLLSYSYVRHRGHSFGKKRTRNIQNHTHTDTFSQSLCSEICTVLILKST